jgi:hypothetical protein
MADPTYIIPGMAFHSFLMFAPFLALYEKKGFVLRGIVFFVSGPFLASLITENLMEQASVWCFFSIAQILALLFTVRGALITKWARNTDHISPVNGNKVHPAKENVAEEMEYKKLT